jgi:hypothetical protein
LAGSGSHGSSAVVGKPLMTNQTAYRCLHGRRFNSKSGQVQCGYSSSAVTTYRLPVESEGTSHLLPGVWTIRRREASSRPRSSRTFSVDMM